MLKDVIIVALLIHCISSSVIAYGNQKSIKELNAKVDGAIHKFENKLSLDIDIKADKIEKGLKNELKDEIRKQFYYIAFIRFWGM